MTPIVKIFHYFELSINIAGEYIIIYLNDSKL